MDTVINRIIELAGPMPDEVAYRRYLRTLSSHALEAKARDLAAEDHKPMTQPVRFWSRAQRLPEPVTA